MMPKVIICNRVLNEARNIARWCSHYPWATKILIADGGSTDNTKEIASKFSNVSIRDFPLRVERNGVWRNPEGKHLNFLFDWARDEGAEWIAFDDCDSFPTKLLQSILSEIFLEKITPDILGVMGIHIYLYGKDQYFPDMNKPGEYFVWAKRANLPFYAEDIDWGCSIIGNPFKKDCLILDKPYTWLHDFCPTPEITQEKMGFYLKSGMLPTDNILEIGGRLERREDWMED